jgi:hypothetical protein
MHGCIVCGKLYQLYVVYGGEGQVMGAKVLSAGGRPVAHEGRALVACERHSSDEIERAVERVFGEHADDDFVD